MRGIAFGATLILCAPFVVLAGSKRPVIVLTPTFKPGHGVFTNAQDVTVSCAITGATIRYTVNGRSPKTNDLVVASGGSVRIAGNVRRLKARAWVDGMEPSRVRSAHFRTPPLPWPYTTPPSLFTLPATNWGIFYTGEPVVVSNSNFTAYEIRDLRSNQVALVSSGQPVTLVDLPAGHYFVSSGEDRNEFAVISPACVGASFVAGETPAGFDFAWEIYSRFRPQLWRAGGRWWQYCEPADGVFTWTNPTNLYANLDTNIDAAVAAGASKVIVEAWYRPSWMEGTNNDAAFVEKYTAFCTALAQHLTDKYSGTLDLGIEVWNEPHYDLMLPFLYDGRASTVMSSYLDVLTNAYKAIKAVNSNIEVVGTVVMEPPKEEIFANFVALGGLNYMDSLGTTDKRWTAYESSRIVTNVSCWSDDEGVTQCETYISTEDDFDTLSRKWISYVQGKPLYLYENALFGHSSLGIPYYYDPLGWPWGALVDHGTTWWQGYIRAQKQVIMGRAAGVSMLLNHVWEGSPNGDPTRPASFAWELSGWEYSPTWVRGGRGPCPKSSAWLAAVARVNGATNFTNLHDSVRWVYAWNNPTNTTVAAWLTEGTAVVSVPFAVTDVYGNPLTSAVGEEPVFWTTDTPPDQAAPNAFAVMGGTP
ncbi:MAG TPA: chitobiase/beta-hexosaminidase C-terminal domain-containing protein [Verrucomicrobiae bacterium]|nr:chitobiase/beta-hexosaminidase C-terminal domain-containing protein [Verrucomicrobiae bacterium]